MDNKNLENQVTTPVIEERRKIWLDDQFVAHVSYNPERSESSGPIYDSQEPEEGPVGWYENRSYA